MAKSRIGLTLILVLVILSAISPLIAAQANGYHIDWWTLDNGGGVSTAARYTLNGTIGQPDASAPLQGGAYTLTGGYWGTSVYHAIFLPLVLRGV